MDLTNISEGMIVKNYKELCDLLNVKIKSGNAKISQLKEVERFINYEKQGYKFIIKEIYSTPNDLIQKGGNNKFNYTESIEKLILDLLVQDKNNGQVFLSKHQLLKQLKMINSNYAYCKENIPKLSKFIDVNVMNVFEFYESSNNTLKRSLDNTLNMLKNKALIEWSNVKTVCIANATNIPTNDLNRIKVNQISKGTNELDEEVFEYNIDYNVNIIHRKAHKEEIQLILRAEETILIELNCANKQEVILNKKWDEFKNKVREILLNSANILYYYDSYNIIFNQDRILNAWEKQNLLLQTQEKAIEQHTLNSSVIDRIQNNIENKHKNAIKKLPNVLNTNKEDKYVRRADDNYLCDGAKLTNTLLNKDSKKIIDKVKHTK
jgi:hypothetical protein